MFRLIRPREKLYEWINWYYKTIAWPIIIIKLKKCHLMFVILIDFIHKLSSILCTTTIFIKYIQCFSFTTQHIVTFILKKYREQTSRPPDKYFLFPYDYYYYYCWLLHINFFFFHSSFFSSYCMHWNVLLNLVWVTVKQARWWKRRKKKKLAVHKRLLPFLNHFYRIN